MLNTLLNTFKNMRKIIIFILLIFAYLGVMGQKAIYSKVTVDTLLSNHLVKADTIYSNKITADKIVAKHIQGDTVIIDSANIVLAGMDTAYIDTASIKLLFADTLTADTASIKLLNADTLTSDTAFVSKMNTNDLNINSSFKMGGLRMWMDTISLKNNIDSLWLPFSTVLFGMVSADTIGHAEAAYFLVNQAGAVTLISNTTNVSIINDTAKLDIIDGGAYAYIKQRLGHKCKIKVVIFY